MIDITTLTTYALVIRYGYICAVLAKIEATDNTITLETKYNRVLGEMEALEKLIMERLQQLNGKI